VLTGPPALLRIVTQPSGTQTGGVVFDVMPVLQLQDAGQNDFTDDTGISVIASLATSPAPTLLDPSFTPTLLGKTVVSTTQGLARFTDLAIDAAGTGYVMNFRVVRTSSSDVIVRDMPALDVQVGEPVALDFRRQPASSASGVALLGKPQIVLVDRGGNAVTGGAPTISAWLVSDNAACEAVPPTLVGDVQHTNPKAIAEISTASLAYPCLSVRMRATVSTGSFIADSAVFSSDVGPPINYEVEYLTHDTVALLWQSPQTGDAPSAFLLTYGPRMGHRTAADTDATLHLAGTSTAAVISGLSAFKAYFFRICSVSRYPGDMIQEGEAQFENAKCASGQPADLVTAPIQAPEYFEVQFVGPDFVDLKWWAPRLGASPPGYKVTVTCNNVTSCTEDEYGREQRANTLVDGRYVQIDAPAAEAAGRPVTFRVTNLTATRGYIFKVVSRAAVMDTVFDDTPLYSPRGLHVETIYPMVVPPRSVTVMCANTPCTGNTILVGWQSASGARHLPRKYKVSIANYSAETERRTDEYDAATIAHGTGGYPTVVITGLAKGVLIQVRVFALSALVDYYGPAAEKMFRPISRPSPPRALSVVVVRNQELRVSWQPPADSGDGTPHGVPIARYRLEYKRVDSVQWTSLPENNVLTMSIYFLEKGLNYSFNCYAISQQVEAEGGASFNSAPSSAFFYYGFSPYWDDINAPPAVNPPALYYSYINYPFSMRIKALDLDQAQNITISATGLSACGAQLTSVTVANPATALLVFLPRPEDSGKTYLICYNAKDAQDMSAPPRCFRLSVASPAPVFTSPLGSLDGTAGADVETAPHVKATVAAIAGCQVMIPVVAIDPTSAGIDGPDAYARGYMVATATSLL